MFWLDSSIRFKTGNLDWLLRQAQSLGILAIVGQAPIASRTQKATFEILQEQPCLYRTKKTKEFQSGFTIVYATDFVMQYVMLPWVTLKCVKDSFSRKGLLFAKRSFIFAKRTFLWLKLLIRIVFDI